MGSRSVPVRLRAGASLDGRGPGRAPGSRPSGADAASASEAASAAAASDSARRQDAGAVAHFRGERPMIMADVLTWFLIVAGTYLILVCYWLASAALFPQ